MSRCVGPYSSEHSRTMEDVAAAENNFTLSSKRFAADWTR